jgi:hypothetical protein
MTFWDSLLVPSSKVKAVLDRLTPDDEIHRLSQTSVTECQQRYVTSQNSADIKYLNLLTKFIVEFGYNLKCEICNLRKSQRWKENNFFKDVTGFIFTLGP